MHYTFDVSHVTGNTVLNVGNGGTSYNAQMMNGASISTSDYKTGSASLQLSGSSLQYVQIPSFTTGTRGLTFACWFRSNNNPTWARIFDFSNAQESDNIAAFINNGYLGISVLNGNFHYQFDNLVSGMNDNVWRHFAWTISTDGTYTVYIDGQTSGSLMKTSQYYPNAISRRLNYLGKSNWAVDPYFTGKIDDFRMYNKVLNTSEIVNLFSMNSLPGIS